MFVRAANPVWYMVDLTGLGLDDRYWAFFLTNDLPYLPQPAYQDENGVNPWADPLQFSPNGTLPNNLYFNPDLVYRIEIRKGPTQADPLIYLIENFVPGGSSSPVITGSFANAVNAITNPQFAFINFANDPNPISPTNPYTITAAGTYSIAPGWSLVLTGSGSTTLTQIAIAGTDNVSGNPPYALHINNSGWTSAKLIQTLNDNGAIFNNGSIAMSILARPYSVAQTLTLSYVPSGTTNATQIASSSLAAGVWSTLGAAVNVNSPSLNSNTGDAAFVQLVITLQPTGMIDITNVQFLGQSAQLGATSVSPAFQEQSIEQELNNTFNVYADAVIRQPKDTILTGWQFSLNPFQFITTAVTTVAAQCQYIADQTILYQQAGANEVQSGQGSAAERFGLKILSRAGHTSNQFALIQYIDPATVLPYWNKILSSMVKATLVTTNNSSVRVKVRLIYRTTLPSTIGAAEPISSWASGADPVFSAGWTAIAPDNDPAYELPTVNSNSDYPGLSFNKMQLPANSTATMTLGIVVYTVDDMITTGTPDYIVFDDISLVRNNFALPSNAKTFDQVLKECQYYYESSYDIGVLPGTISQDSQLTLLQQAFHDGTTFASYASSFGVMFNTIKRAVSLLTIYSPTTNPSGNGKIDAYLKINALAAISSVITLSTHWAANYNGVKGFQYNGDAAETNSHVAPLTGFNSYVNFHFTADARLGI